MGWMKGTSRVLVTNHLHFLNCADKIIVLENQEPVFVGTYEELNRSQVNLTSLINQQTQDTGESEEEAHSGGVTTTTEAKREADEEASLEKTPRPTTASPSDAQQSKVCSAPAKMQTSTQTSTSQTNKQEGDAEAGKLTKKETMEKGAVAWGVVKKYIAAGNIVMFAAIVFSFLNRLVARVWYSWSLSQWTNDAEEAELWGLSQSSSQSSLFPTSSERNERVAEVNNHYVVVQGLLLLYETAAYVIVGVLWMFFGRRASAKIQKGFINLIAFAKATFYDTFVPNTKHPTQQNEHKDASDALVDLQQQQDTAWPPDFALLQGLCLSHTTTRTNNHTTLVKQGTTRDLHG